MNFTKRGSAMDNSFVDVVDAGEELLLKAHAIAVRIEERASQVMDQPPRRSVLVVDDDLSTRECLKLALEGRGHNVACAANGREALEQLRSSPLPGLIVLDLVMPVMDGAQFLREQRKDPRLAHIPVVVISAASREQAVALSAAGYLQKPLDVEQLTARVGSYATPMPN
jgi:CheY-like chemotaxis protein